MERNHRTAPTAATEFVADQSPPFAQNENTTNAMNATIDEARSEETTQ